MASGIRAVNYREPCIFIATDLWAVAIAVDLLPALTGQGHGHINHYNPVNTHSKCLIIIVTIFYTP